MSEAIQLISEPSQAAALVQPVRQRILEELREPASAAGIARQLGLPRQKVNYHLRELERLGLVEQVDERRRGNCVEKLMLARSSQFVLAPQVLGAIGTTDVAEQADRFSWAHLVRVIVRTLRELGRMRRKADETGRRIATFTLESEIRFASPADFNRFAEDLSTSVGELIARYHDDQSSTGRRFRLLAACHPLLSESQPASQGQGDDDAKELQSAN